MPHPNSTPKFHTSHTTRTPSHNKQRKPSTPPPLMSGAASSGASRPGNAAFELIAAAGSAAELLPPPPAKSAAVPIQSPAAAASTRPLRPSHGGLGGGLEGGAEIRRILQRGAPSAAAGRDSPPQGHSTGGPSGPCFFLGVSPPTRSGGAANPLVQDALWRRDPYAACRCNLQALREMDARAGGAFLGGGSGGRGDYRLLLGSPDVGALSALADTEGCCAAPPSLPMWGGGGYDAEPAHQRYYSSPHGGSFEDAASAAGGGDALGSAFCAPPFASSHRQQPPGVVIGRTSPAQCYTAAGVWLA